MKSKKGKPNNGIPINLLKKQKFGLRPIFWLLWLLWVAPMVD